MTNKCPLREGVNLCEFMNIDVYLLPLKGKICTLTYCQVKLWLKGWRVISYRV